MKINHFKISLIKSLLRIISCTGSLILVFSNIRAAFAILVSGLCIAEILGILEEVFDKRKEK